MTTRVRGTGAQTDTGVVAPARWRPIAALALSLGGLGVSIYLTITHFAPAALVCSANGLVNCAKVTTSPQSYVFGIPVAILGLGFFVAMTVVNLPAAWHTADRRVHLLRLAMSVVGMGFVLYLVAAELVIIGNICLWCTSVHAITFLLFVLLVTTVPQMVGWAPAEERTPPDATAFDQIDGDPTG
jgi:uncharacterized membrane protein